MRVEGGDVKSFILSDQNFPPTLPCTAGECAKIIRIEDASLSELLQCWLDITKGREIPPGSVVVIFSASHLLMEGLNGYISDLVKELRRFDSIFEGGLFAIPGLPVFLDGCSSPELIRDLWDMMCWLKHIGNLDLKRGWCALMESFIGKGGGGKEFQGNRRIKVRLPDDLRSYPSRSWVSAGGATLFNEVPPVSTALEERIISGLLTDLNNKYDLGLDTKPNLTRASAESETTKPRILVIGGSHAGRTGDEFEERGYEVLRVCSPGWRPTRAAVQEILPKIENAKTMMREDDIVLLHCLDNVSYFARTEEGGDMPIRRGDDGDFHVEGDLILASKDRQLILFNTIEPILQLLAIFKLLLVTPMPRFLYEGCCPLESHASNRFEDGFEVKLRVGLREFRINIKNFAFMRNLRNIKVLDPSPVLQHTDEDGEDIWGMDPVHPLLHGYRLLCDMYETEISQLACKTRKRSGEAIQPPPKRAKAEPRPAWIEKPRQHAVRKDWKEDRGG